MASVQDVAKYILTQSDPDIGDVITPLKLQKLLYYSQGCNLGLHGKILFNDDIEAWTHGPVVRSIYEEYKEYGRKAIIIDDPHCLDCDTLTDQDKELIREVYKVYGQFSAWKLSSMSHSEPPWNSTPLNQIIPVEIISNFFITQVICN